MAGVEWDNEKPVIEVRPLSKSERKSFSKLQFGIPRMAPVIKHLLDLRAIMESQQRSSSTTIPPEK